MSIDQLIIKANKLGHSQDDIARKCGVSQSTVNRYLSGGGPRRNKAGTVEEKLRTGLQGLVQGVGV